MCVERERERSSEVRSRRATGEVVEDAGSVIVGLAGLADIVGEQKSVHKNRNDKRESQLTEEELGALKE